MKHPDIELHIEELVLHGFSPADRHGILDALQAELAQLLSSSDPSVIGSTERPIDAIDAGSIRIASSAKPETIGKQIAESVIGGMKP